LLLQLTAELVVDINTKFDFVAVLVLLEPLQWVY